MIELFKFLDIESISNCNRKCPNCLRNSHPDRAAMAERFENVILPTESITEAVRQAWELGFRGTVILSHYNEPTMDDRLPMLVQIVREQGLKCMLHTNGDFITEQLAKQLDPHLNEIRVSLYMDDPVKSTRRRMINGFFKRTKVEMLTGEHIATHFAPDFPVRSLAEQHIDHNCLEPQMHCIISYEGKYLLCCEDVIGNYDLGRFPEVSLEDYWFGDKHSHIVETLERVSGRRQFSYCSTCPRT